MTKVIENIPTRESLDKLIEDFKAAGFSETSYKQQADGSFHLVIFGNSIGEVVSKTPEDKTLILE